MDPTERFSTRVDHYVQSRPRYPGTLISILREECGLTPGSVVADIGSEGHVAFDYATRLYYGQLTSAVGEQDGRLSGRADC
jgi:hypothetical protein